MLNEKLQNVLQELKVARSIIALLREDMNNSFYWNVKKVNPGIILTILMLKVLIYF